MTKAIGARLAATVLLGLVLVLAPAALAGKDGKGKPGGGTTGGGGSSLTHVVVSSPYNDGVAHYRGQVTFALNTSATRPYVSLVCRQGGTLVLQGSAGFFDGYPWSNVFPLSSEAWVGGAADCTATLYTLNAQGTRRYDLATTTFRAEA